MTKLNIGCGREILDGYINIDRTREHGAEVGFDLEKADSEHWRLPFANDSITEMRAFHVLEHINNILPLMQELYRIAAPDCIFYVKVPHGATEVAYADPTHVRQMFPSSFGYFSQPNYWKADYGYRGDWKVDEMITTVHPALCEYLETIGLPMEFAANHFYNVFDEIIVQLSPCKPIRKPLRELQEKLQVHISPLKIEE